jgi:hypothetical protein
MKSLARLNEFDRIERLSDQMLVVHFGQISMRMELDEFLIVASMFDLSKGEEMPDEEICNVSLDAEGKYTLAYRSVRLILCNNALKRFSRLCLMAMDKLEGRPGSFTRERTRQSPKKPYLYLVTDCNNARI